ncbi:MAG TPA: DUF1800 family protein [Ilumatobacteraceae bacterium]|nr:DUF1800 family protein [Ilumatobacteraceae bacterium]
MAPAPLTEANVRHLLRRTEFVDRPDRVAELLELADIDAAVANILAVNPAPPSVTFTAPADRDWERGRDLTHFWLDQMAHDSARPFQERMAFFWHGHFCSEFGKVGSSMLMREQIDLWRREGLGNIRSLATTMSTQVAMIRYLDNNQNKKTSPNQNFARELMELFLLGVGNYTEADVEASTAAWTGHSDQWDDEVDPYRWRPEWHDSSPKDFLGRRINADPDPDAWRGHGPETIAVMLGDGVVPAGADNVANRGRSSRAVAAEFLSRKLWTSFATDTSQPPGVMAAMRDALLDDFDVRPWVTAMLTHPDFYTDAVRRGLVRTPVEFVVALLAATGQRSRDADMTWLMGAMGQQLLYPPNVSGWRPNGYWVNASAMEGRARTAQQMNWASARTYWSGDDGPITLAGGSIMRSEITARTPWPDSQPVLSNAALVARLLELMRIQLSPAATAEIVRYADGATVWERNNAVLLIMLAPEMQMA